VTEFRVELLGRLGLRDSASDQDVERAHGELVDFLELAPRDMKSWATARTTDVDEAFALLSGPDEDLIPPAAQVVTTVLDQPETPVPPAVSEPTAPPAASAPAEPVDPQTLTSPSRWPRRRTYLLWAILPLLVVVVVLGVYRMGKTSSVPGISGTPTNAATSAAPGTAKPVDQTKVVALMTKITTNPKDIASLQALGDLYFGALDYKNATLWENKVLALDPKNQTGLLALGAAQFNQGNAVGAKKTWLLAAGLYPKSAVVHYDLGFLYLSQTPPDKVNMTAEWNKVIAIDPNSQIAKTVASHLKTAVTPTPTAK